VGSGKYKRPQTREATDAAQAEIITVAIRRVNIGQDPKAPSLLDAAALAVHHPAEHGRLLQRQGRHLHAADGARAAEWPSW
jgi:hypothetical protein